MLNRVILIVFCLVTFSCTKQTCIEEIALPLNSVATPAGGSLVGTWKLVLVKDVSSNVTTTKPPDIKGDVVFTLVSPEGARFNGRTPSNYFSCDYLANSNGDISITFVMTSKAMETSWGMLFWNHILSAGRFSFGSNGRLHISTSTGSILTFIRQ